MRRFFFFISFPILASAIYYGALGGPLNLDPPAQWDSSSSLIVSNLYDRLVYLEPDTIQIKPSLAVSWKIKDNGLRWVFNLRRGVKFCDGTSLDARAVVLSFKRQIGKYPASLSIFPYIKDVKEIGKMSVEFILSRKFSPFLYTLATPQASIISAKAIEENEKGLKNNPVGSGPYYLASWEKGKRLVLKTNPEYWRKIQGADKIIFIIGSFQNLNNLFIEEKLDMMEAVSISKAETLKDSRFFALFSKPLFSLDYIVFNPKHRWGKNPVVREALTRLWNSQWVKTIFGNYVEEAHNLLPKPWEKNRKWDLFSPKIAERLIKSHGFYGKIKIDLIYCCEDPLLSRVFKAYSLAAKKAGVELEIISLKEKKFEEEVKAGDYGMAYSSWILDYPDPDSLFYPLISKELFELGLPNLLSFQDQILKKLILKAREEYSEKRMEIYRKAETRMRKKYYIIPVSRTKLILLYNRRVKKIVADPMGIIDFSKMIKNEH